MVSLLISNCQGLMQPVECFNVFGANRITNYAVNSMVSIYFYFKYDLHAILNQMRIAILILSWNREQFVLIFLERIHTSFCVIHHVCVLWLQPILPGSWKWVTCYWSSFWIVIGRRWFWGIQFDFVMKQKKVCVNDKRVGKWILFE